MTKTLSPAWWAAAAIAAVGALTLFVAIQMPAKAASNLFGGAVQQDNFAALLSNTNNASTADDFSGINFTVASGTTLSSLGTLSARYNVTDTNCSGGSPRFQINVQNGTTTGNIFAYLGPEPNYNTCSTNTWEQSGNALGGPRTLDTSQLPGGTFYDTWAHASSTYGNWQVTGVQLVVDAGWAIPGGVQRIRVTDATVGGTAYMFPAATTTPPEEEDDADALIDALEALQSQYPDFYWQLQWLINDLMDDDNGTTTPPTPPNPGTASIDNNGRTVGPNGHLDFVGRNFGNDEMVNMTLSGSLVRTIRADGGGNFSTGSMTAPGSPGTYNYVFTGQTSGRTATSTITVSP